MFLHLSRRITSQALILINNYSENDGGRMLLMSFPAGVTRNQKPTTFEQGNKEGDSAVQETRFGFDV